MIERDGLINVSNLAVMVGFQGDARVWMDRELFEIGMDPETARDDRIDRILNGAFWALARGRGVGSSHTFKPRGALTRAGMRIGSVRCLLEYVDTLDHDDRADFADVIITKRRI